MDNTGTEATSSGVLNNPIVLIEKNDFKINTVSQMFSHFFKIFNNRTTMFLF